MITVIVDSSRKINAYQHICKNAIRSVLKRVIPVVNAEALLTWVSVRQSRREAGAARCPCDLMAPEGSAEWYQP